MLRSCQIQVDGELRVVKKVFGKLLPEFPGDNPNGGGSSVWGASPNGGKGCGQCILIKAASAMPAYAKQGCAKRADGDNRYLLMFGVDGFESGSPEIGDEGFFSGGTLYEPSSAHRPALRARFHFALAL